MGASVLAYWPGITAEQLETQPGFFNDDKAWGNWMAEREEDPAVSAAIRKLNAEAILTLKTDGWEDDDASWVSPSNFGMPLEGCARRSKAEHRRLVRFLQAMSAMPTASTRSRRSSCVT